MPISETKKKIALLAANGFNEDHMTAIQRKLTQSGLSFSLVAPEQGLVNGWQNDTWGHYFTVDQAISAALGSDYDALILVGGERGVAKLKANPHARRIVNHFVEAEKPVAAVGAGVALLALSEAIANRTVSADPASVEDMKLARAILSEAEQEKDGSILTSRGTNIDAFAEEVVTVMSQIETAEDPAGMEQAA